MIKLYDTGAYLVGGKLVPDDAHAAAALQAAGKSADKNAAAAKTMAYSILEAHNTSGNMDALKIKFDAKMCIRDRNSGAGCRKRRILC